MKSKCPNTCKIDKDGTLLISVWYGNGFIMTRRDALEYDHEQSFPSCIIRLGRNPEDYGYHNVCKHCGR